ncbi:hypothetical protein [Actinomycetospora sp.]|uniref:hypothetical protein n=1 Tax=Actinomycetospora sp. TaxID=1872135 RepID=UPI002F400418
MTGPGPLGTWDLNPAADSKITLVQAYRAALVVARHLGDQPAEVRELLAMLGLVDPGGDTPAGSAPAEPGTSARALVDTAAAVEALHLPEATLNWFARAEIVRPARVDPDGSRWWNLPDLRSQIAPYRGEDRNGHRKRRS